MLSTQYVLDNVVLIMTFKNPVREIPSLLLSSISSSLSTGWTRLTDTHYLSPITARGSWSQLYGRSVSPTLPSS
jgi:hypothetical protein